MIIPEEILIEEARDRLRLRGKKQAREHLEKNGVSRIRIDEIMHSLGAESAEKRGHNRKRAVGGIALGALLSLYPAYFLFWYFTSAPGETMHVYWMLLLAGPVILAVSLLDFIFGFEASDAND